MKYQLSKLKLLELNIIQVRQVRVCHFSPKLGKLKLAILPFDILVDLSQLVDSHQKSAVH